MDQSIYEVRRCVDGAWKVFEGNAGEPISSFIEKHDAIDFAWDMARLRHPAAIRVLAVDGTLLGTRMTTTEAARLPMTASYAFPSFAPSLL